MELTLDQALQKGIEAHRSGNVQEADRYYTAILKANPKHADANHNMGVLAVGVGKVEEALPFFKTALEANPSTAQYWLSYIDALIKLDRMADAKAVLDQAKSKGAKGDGFDQLENRLKAFIPTSKNVALQNEKEQPNVLDNLKLDQAVKLAQKKAKDGSTDEAKLIYEDILIKFPKNKKAIEGIKALSVASLSKISAVQDPPQDRVKPVVNLYTQGQLEKALLEASKLLLEFPNSVILYNIMGAASKGLGRLEESIEAFTKVLSIKPDFSEAYNNMGNALRELGKPKEAIKAYKTSISIKPDFAEAYYNIGFTLHHQGKLEEAIEAYNKALSIKPDFADAYNNMGVTLKEQDKLEEAIDAFTKALSIKPEYVGAHYNMGITLKNQGRLDEAIEAFRKTISLNADHYTAYSSLVDTEANMCKWTKLNYNLLEGYLSKISTDKIVYPILPFPFLHSNPSPKRHLKLCTLYAENTFKNTSSNFCKKPVAIRNKLRIGYFSPDFNEHPVAQMIEGVFRHHDRDNFEILAYSFGPNDRSEMRLRIENAVDVFIDCQSKSTDEIVMLARKDQIDIAIDLAGYTRNNKANIFNCRVAPIQINYLGYPGTMGADFIDYIIADRVLIPKEMERFYTEKVIFMPNTYQPTNDSLVLSKKIPSREELGLPKSAFVFCAINQGYKIKSKEFGIWMRLLKKVEGSVLWLKRQNESMVLNLKSAAVKRGVDPSRLIFACRVDHEKYLAQFKQADLYLDTFNYNAGTTASDILMAQLPIVTKMGNSYASRMVASLLNACNMNDLITKTAKDYERLSLELAMQPNKLKKVKQCLAQNSKNTTIFDTKLYTCNLEVAYNKAFDLYFTGQAPENIEIRGNSVLENKRSSL